MSPPDGYPIHTLDGTAEAEVVSGVVAPFTAGNGARSVPCGRAFADAVLDLAARRGTDPSALASAALLLGGALGDDPGAQDPGAQDPGAQDPGVEDEAGAAALELRLPARHDDAAIRRALACALALADPSGWRLVRAADVARQQMRVETLEYRNRALANALERVSFQPLDGRLNDVRDAARLFGFINEWCFDEDRVVRRFRELAPVYHPDTGVVGCRERMAQLIEARNILVNHVRTAYRAGAWGKRSAAR